MATKVLQMFLQSLCFRFTSQDAVFGHICRGFFRKWKTYIYIFVHKFLATSPTNWLGWIPWQSCGTVMNTYCFFLCGNLFFNWSSSSFKLSTKFLKMGIYFSPSWGFCKYSVTCLRQERSLVSFWWGVIKYALRWSLDFKTNAHWSTHVMEMVCTGYGNDVKVYIVTFSVIS